MILIGASLGASHTLPRILARLPRDLPVAVAIVIHRHRDSDFRLIELLQRGCPCPVVEVVDKQLIEAGKVYLGPPDYHLLVEEEHFELSTDDPVNFARPSIDVLFESAADAFGPKAIGVLLTGASSDGADGLVRIRELGGRVVVQDPQDAECAVMPTSALNKIRPDHVCRADELAGILTRLVRS